MWNFTSYLLQKGLLYPTFWFEKVIPLPFFWRSGRKLILNDKIVSYECLPTEKQPPPRWHRQQAKAGMNWRRNSTRLTTLTSTITPKETNPRWAMLCFVGRYFHIRFVLLIKKSFLDTLLFFLHISYPIDCGENVCSRLLYTFLYQLSETTTYESCNGVLSWFPSCVLVCLLIKACIDSVIIYLTVGGDAGKA